jgi:hypothetical protein
VQDGSIYLFGLQLDGWNLSCLENLGRPSFNKGFVQRRSNLLPLLSTHSSLFALAHCLFSSLEILDGLISHHLRLGILGL